MGKVFHDFTYHFFVMISSVALTAFTSSLSLITVAELGDKTFFIAMILAMRHRRRWVFWGVMVGLTAMVLLSVAIGQVLSRFPPVYTHYGAIVLFLFFGGRLLWQGSRMKNQGDLEEMEEAKEDIDRRKQPAFLSRFSLDRPLGIMVQSGVLTFLAEWGDRTQITTITLAAQYPATWVTLGAVAGHGVCALIAVMGGKWIAGRISEKTVTLVGGVLFLLFALVALVNGPA